MRYYQDRSIVVGVSLGRGIGFGLSRVFRFFRFFRFVRFLVREEESLEPCCYTSAEAAVSHHGIHTQSVSQKGSDDRDKDNQSTKDVKGASLTYSSPDSTSGGNASPFPLLLPSRDPSPRSISPEWLRTVKLGWSFNLATISAVYLTQLFLSQFRSWRTAVGYSCTDLIRP